MERVNDIAFQDCQILMCDSRASLGEVDYKDAIGHRQCRYCQL